MRNPEEFKIACYMAWSGAEATFQFENKSQYDAARAFLDKISVAHLHGKELPPGFSKTVTDFYCIESRDRAAFRKFMREGMKPA